MISVYCSETGSASLGSQSEIPTACKYKPSHTGPSKASVIRIAKIGGQLLSVRAGVFFKTVFVTMGMTERMLVNAMLIAIASTIFYLCILG